MSIFETIGNTDWIGLVNFASTATKSNNGRLVRGTRANRVALTNTIGNIESSGMTNYEDAFIKAYEMF